MRTNFSIILLSLYSLILGLSNSLHFTMLLPIFLEMYRVRFGLFEVFKRLVLLNLFISVVTISVVFWDKNLALLIFLRSNMVVLFALLLFYGKNYFDIAYGLERLRVPSKIVSLFYFNGKFIYLLSNEIKIFKKNLLLRSFNPKVNIFTYQTYANFIGLLFVQAFYRANTLSNILITRGFDGKIYTLSEPKKVSIYEITLFTCTILSLSLGVFI